MRLTIVLKFRFGSTGVMIGVMMRVGEAVRVGVINGLPDIKIFKICHPNLLSNHNRSPPPFVTPANTIHNSHSNPKAFLILIPFPTQPRYKFCFA